MLGYGQALIEKGSYRHNRNVIVLFLSLATIPQKGKAKGVGLKVFPAQESAPTYKIHPHHAGQFALKSPQAFAPEAAKP